jgi:hypothetical protein
MDVVASEKVKVGERDFLLTLLIFPTASSRNNTIQSACVTLIVQCTEYKKSSLQIQNTTTGKIRNLLFRPLACNCMNSQ